MNGALALAVVCTAGMCAQQATFEVASVKPWVAGGSHPGMTGGPGTADPGRISYAGVPLQLRLMLRALLTERFRFVYHIVGAEA